VYDDARASTADQCRVRVLHAGYHLPQHVVAAVHVAGCIRRARLIATRATCHRVTTRHATVKGKISQQK